LLDRARGEFMRPWDQLDEPARTERLLANPFVFFKPNVADSIDSMKLVMLNRASGYSFRGVTYDFLAISIQLVIAGLNGIGPSLAKGSDGASNQLATVCSVQWATAAWIICVQPSLDRVDALVMSIQFSLEGLVTFVLLTQTDGSQASLAFVLSLCALMVSN
jgi:hypothetical protein